MRNEEATQSYTKESTLKSLSFSCAQAAFAVSAIFSNKLHLVWIAMTQGSG